MRFLQKIRDIVSDADKIEAVGISGIIRMIQFEETIIPNTISYNDKIKRHMDHITKYSHNNAYLLVSNNYIKTDTAKKIVSEKIEEMKEIVDNKTNLLKCIEIYLKTNS